MKAIGRERIYCVKKLPCGVREAFWVVVKSSQLQEAKNNYKSMGYKVY